MNFPSVEGSSTEQRERSITTFFPLGAVDPDGSQVMLKVTTMHSKARKVYASTIGNIRRTPAPEYGGHVDTWMPLDDARFQSVPGGRFSRKTLVATHDEAINALRKTDNPALTRYFSADQPALANG